MLQLREKDLDEKSFMEEAAAVKALCARYQVPFLIDDNVSLALRCGADGVHVGQSDMEAGEVRARIGPDKILGVSAQTVSQAVLAQEAGADYLGVGAVFSTSTKLDADTVSLETLREICTAVKIPVVAIGGINEGKFTGAHRQWDQRCGGSVSNFCRTVARRCGEKAFHACAAGCAGGRIEVEKVEGELLHENDRSHF